MKRIGGLPHPTLCRLHDDGSCSLTVNASDLLPSKAPASLTTSPTYTGSPLESTVDKGGDEHLHGCGFEPTHESVAGLAVNKVNASFFS